ncbi:MAG: tetratricopeptide repeat protein [Bacteroidetes bacterium]|nr:tetratricopeptide repeat protein [Bacteroidota bacterium]
MNFHLSNRIPFSAIFYFFFFLLLAIPRLAISQNDSLLSLVKNAGSDTAKFRICNQISVKLSPTDNKSSIYFAKQALEIATKRKNNLEKSEAMNNLAYALYYSGESDTALNIFHKSIKLARAVGDSNNVIFAMNKLGFIYREKGDYPKALISYNQALTSNIGEKNVEEAANSYLNIGVIYNDQKNYKDALRYEETGLRLYQKAGNESRVANSYARIGNTYLDLTDTIKAIDYYEKSLALFSKSNNLRGIAVCLNNLANIYNYQNNIPKAIDYYNRALEIREKIGDKNGIALICNNLGDLYIEDGKFDQAILYENKSLALARELDYRDMMKSDYLSLSKAYEKLGDDKKALDYYKQYYEINDSIFNEKNSEQVNELNTKFDTERRQKAFESLAKENNLKAVALDEQKRRNLFMGSALVLLVILVFVIYRNATKSKQANVILEKQKNEIALQKKIVDEQHHDMLDSINYAKRIQFAVLPTQEEMRELFPGSFVFFRPRDIVSGDFWWIGKSGKTKIVAVVDCTGHGVPGAFMSLIGNTALNEVVKEKHITDPGEILTQMANVVVAALKQTNFDRPEGNLLSMKGVKDGMDISLCCIDEENNVLKFAGANNPLYYITNGEMHEIKGDRQPVGVFQGHLKPFTVHTIPLKDLDAFYMFTDGFADQFGGASGKKFKYSQLKETLLTISGKNLAQQKNSIEKTFDDWKGELDQVDDVLLAGVIIK